MESKFKHAPPINHTLTSAVTQTFTFKPKFSNFNIYINISKKLLITPHASPGEGGFSLSAEAGKKQYLLLG